MRAAKMLNEQGNAAMKKTGAFIITEMSTTAFFMCPADQYSGILINNIWRIICR